MVLKVSNWNSLALGAVAGACLIAVAGCQEPATLAQAQEAPQAELTLREGDVVKISFPGASDLNPPEPLQIRRDGKITLPIVGEVGAAGLTPTELQNNLLTQFSKQLRSKEVIVTVISSTFVVFVDGNVVHPGKIVSDHPITLLEAVMEAGGFDYKRADLSRIRVIRRQAGSGEYNYYTVNLKLVLDGRQGDAFHLAPGDVVHVPERFAWF